MTITAFLGTGLLGSGFVESMLGRGERVSVWNRTRAKAEPLGVLGATIHGEAALAVRGASRVHLCLSDDAAVDTVLDTIVLALEKDAWVIDHSTTSPAGVRARYQRAARDGFRFAHAPVFMSPAMAREAKGMMLLSGPPSMIEMVSPILRPMTGELLVLGDRLDMAASCKLFGNAMLITIAGGLADVFAMGHALGIAPDNALELFTKFNPAMGIQVRGQRMARGDFAASFELTMARKDVALMTEAAGKEPLAVLPAILARMDTLIAQGHGKQDLGVLAVESVVRKVVSQQDASNAVLDRLRTSHRRIDERLETLEKSVAEGDAAGVDEVIAFYERSIVRHEDDEERSLFPRLTGMPEAEPLVAKLIQEHHAQKVLWDRLTHASREIPEQLGVVATDLRESYRRHVSVEEEELFPLIAKRLPAEEWSTIDQEMRQRRGR